MFGQITWSFFRRFVLMRQGTGLWFGVRTFVCKRSRFSGPAKIYGRSRITNSKMGRYCYAVDAEIRNAELGNFCSIAPGVRIGGLGTHPLNFISTHPAFYSTRGQAGASFAAKTVFPEESKRVTIHNDVWIGAHVLILDGVSIGNGAVIAAGAVVVKNVPPYAIVGGVPARLIRYRFTNEIMAVLEDLAWWDLPDEKLRDIAFILGRPVDNETGVNQLIEAIRNADACG